MGFILGLERRKLLRVFLSIVIFSLGLVSITACASLKNRNAELVSDKDTGSKLVVLDDGCPELNDSLDFKIICQKIDYAAGKGEHSQLIAEALAKFNNRVTSTLDEVIFINVADINGNVSVDNLVTGSKLAASLKPSAIVISYSASITNKSLEESFESLRKKEIKVFASFSNLFLEEESYPALFPSVTGVKLGDSFRQEQDGSLVLDSKFVSTFTDGNSSTSLATILAAGLWFSCTGINASLNDYNTICSQLKL